MYLIRHLPTKWNILGLLQGRRNIPINVIADIDLNLIEKNKIGLRNLIDPVVVTSQLVRTKQTAVAYGFEIFTEDAITNELDFGSYEGKSRLDLIHDTGGAWLNDPRDILLGEKLIDFEARMMSVLERYYCIDTVILFTHGAVIRALCSILQYGDISKMNQLTVNNNELIVI